MEEIEKIKKLLYLKQVYRAGDKKGSKESTAEHVYGCLVLAQYFLKEVREKLDELRVMKLILYHDLVEIETGDIFILDKEKRENKEEEEKKGAKRLMEKIPEKISGEYEEYFKEYEKRESKEAKFAKAIDCLEPMIHWMIYAENWTEYGFSEDVLREKKEKHVAEFPELLEFWNGLIEELKKQGYF